MKIQLTNNGLKSEIDTKGAYVNTLSKDGVDILFPRTTIVESGKEKVRGGSHPCLPHFGISEKIGLSNHGFARDLEWNVVSQDESSVVLSLKPEVENWEGMYAELEYILEDSSFSTNLTVKNEGKDSIQITPAFHPYFNYTDENEVYINGEKFDMNYETLPDSLFVDEVNSIKTSEYEVEIENKDMTKFVIWTNFSDNYLCVEPSYNWQALDRGGDLLKLEFGDEAKFGYTVRVK